MNKIVLELNPHEAESLRYAIAAWFTLNEGEDWSGADHRRSRDLDKLQDDIRSQERKLEINQ